MRQKPAHCEDHLWNYIHDRTDIRNQQMKKVSIHDEIAQETFYFMKKQIVKRTKKEVLVQELIDLIMKSLVTININMVHSMRQLTTPNKQPISISSLQRIFEDIMCNAFEELKERTDNEKQKN